MSTEELGTTPSQTIGPFLSIALTWADGDQVVPVGTTGAVRIAGRLLDGAGAPVADGLIESWQADPDGHFAHPDDPFGGSVRPDGFRGFGRSATDADGRWSLTTMVPGALPTPDGSTEAPHLDLSIFARGLLNRVVTRLYFPEDEAALAADPVLNSVPANRRKTLLARTDGDAAYVFDVILQGDRETVFFDL